MRLAAPCPCRAGNIFTWDVSHVIGYHAESIEGKELVCKAWCSKHADKVRRDGGLRGQAKKDMLKFIEGTNLVTKYTLNTKRRLSWLEMRSWQADMHQVLHTCYALRVAL